MFAIANVHQAGLTSLFDKRSSSTQQVHGELARQASSLLAGQAYIDLA